jgi:hypothetical protein
MKSFPMNIEVIQDFTYNASKPPRRLRNNKHSNESVDDFMPEN